MCRYGVDSLLLTSEEHFLAGVFRFVGVLFVLDVDVSGEMFSERNGIKCNFVEGNAPLSNTMYNWK